ncbi:uncharacterized protein [Physcomitrium patens]|uniref:N-acetyltransferase domain-containing protein n=1 Tax=Physcomitrium patens TaxID=3218 RepID=A9SPK9_PHYPA|nr:uncharacterized protein LOC112276786 [Physcomitrium patens]PNR28692.1 hypothetical protein PHYPA_029285 [Physcomitrium patens]|eukprot:XP_024364249.1 uncharacterized protein LOC112276786 [Physcomitrella patens]
MGLETQRIVLRTPSPEDDDTFISFFSDPMTMQHLPVFLSKPWDRARMAARREANEGQELLGRARNFTVLLRHGNKDLGLEVIGQAGYRSLWMEESPKRGEMGLILGHAYHGRGLVWDVHLVLLTFGFEVLGLEMVEWVTSEGNEGMRTVLRKIGCTDVGVLVEDGSDPLWGTQVKYTLHSYDWAKSKMRLRERVDRWVTKTQHKSEDVGSA